jgi:hypothetical protein
MNGCWPTHCTNSQHFQTTQLYFYARMDIYLFVLLNFYLLYQRYCCDFTPWFTSQIVAYELTHSINVQFLSLNCFTVYWMCKENSSKNIACFTRWEFDYISNTQNLQLFWVCVLLLRRRRIWTYTRIIHFVVGIVGSVILSNTLRLGIVYRAQKENQ